MKEGKEKEERLKGGRVETRKGRQEEELKGGREERRKG